VCVSDVDFTETGAMSNLLVFGWSPFSVCLHTIAPGTNNGATVMGHSLTQARQQTYSCVKTHRPGSES